MSSEYPKAPIGKVAKVRSGFAFKSSDWQNDGIPVVKIANVKDGRLEMNGCSCVSNEVALTAKDFLLDEGDILISMTGYVGDLARVRIEDTPCALNQRVGRFHSYDRELIDPSFLFFHLRSKEIRSEIEQKAYGSAQPNISAGGIEETCIYLPELKDQRAIAHILGTLDDKIELNRKTNETLEAMAKALFKSWFVDFDPVKAKSEGRPTGLPAEISDLFPDSFEDSELGEIPSGWAIRSVSEITERVAMGPFGSNIKVSTFVESGVPVISGAHLKGVLLQDADYRFVTEEHSHRLANSCVSSGDIVFTHAGTIGQVALIPENSEYAKYVLSQRQFYARPLRRSLRHYLLMYFHSEKGRHELLSNASQTGVPSIARPATFLKSIRMPLPGEDLLILFDQIMSDLMTRMRSVTGNTSNLVSIRDTLLPKLISGEIRIPDAEKMLEEVGV